ncbi:hypothetical protein [Pseudomonas nicosulfuronedens]
MNRTPTTPKAPAGQKTVLPLPKQPGSACAASSEESFGTPSLSCSPIYDDILYVPFEDPGDARNGKVDDKAAFWLLRKQTANTLRDKSEQLQKMVSPGMPPQERKKGLDDAGLLEHFLEPQLSQFLVGEQKARMQVIEEQNPRMRETFQAEWPHTRLDPRAVAREHNHPLQPRNKLLAEWKGLSDLAVHNAEKQGYTYRDGRLYSAQAEAARKAVEAYNKARSSVLEEFDTLGDVLDKIAKLLQETKVRYEEATRCAAGYRECRGALIGVLLWKDGYKKYFSYVEAILEAANYGLALPEYALIGGYPEGIAGGIQRFKEYVTLAARQKNIEEELRRKYREWVDATGSNVPPPAGLLDAERQAWRELDAKLQALHQQAVDSVAQSQPRRHLLWHPEDFAPDPVERVVKTSFPLREVSLPGTPNGPLIHFSLDMLEGLKQIPASSTGMAAQDHATSRFHDWLTREGALRIDAQGEWFDPQGWFDAEAFHRYLKEHRYQVKSLADAAARKAWDDRLLQILFKKDVQRLRLFDASPSAQLVRCLTPPQEDIHLSLKAEGPSLSNTGVGASVKLAFDINLARGEIEIGRIDLPERGKAKKFEVPYQLQGDPTQRSLDLGYFSMHLSARAWGFAGASLLIAGEVELRPGNLRLGANLDPIERATRDPNTRSAADNLETNPVLGGAAANAQIENGAKAGFNLFAGVQAGILTTGALNWAPPNTLQTACRIPGTNVPVAVSRSADALPDECWVSLARLEASFAGAVGGGGKGEVNLSVSGGCLILRLNAALIAGPGVEGSLSFAVGYQGVADLLNIVRRELHHNQQRPIKWVSDDAMAFLSRLNMAAALGIDLGMAYLLNFANVHINTNLAIVDFVMSVGDALFDGGRGGLIAHSILNYENQAELEGWFVECIPQGLGPLLKALISKPKEFDDPEQPSQKISPERSHLYQQQAIERILGWILANANNDSAQLLLAQKQFDEACSRMNKFGSLERQQNQDYCINRMLMDRFMAVSVKDVDDPRANDMRLQYFEHVRVLGVLRDGFCKEVKVSDYYGVEYLPGSTRVYTGGGHE